MRIQIALATAVIMAAVSSAAAQSSTATSGTTKPMTTAPASSTTQDGKSGTIRRGIRVGPGAVDGNDLVIKRTK